MTASIRTATAADLPSILRIFSEDEHGGSRESAFDPDVRQRNAAEAFAEIDGDPRQLLWVAERDGRVVGTLQVTFLRYLSYAGATVALVESVQVDKKERGDGIGTQLMRAAIDEARRRGCNRVQLTSNVRRKDAHRFYERLGFVASHVGFKLFL